MKIKHFLQLIRYKNLLMLVFMMLLFKFVFYNAIPQIAIFNITFLILATISITTAGNIINDFFDLENDLINKPNKVIITKFISKKKALLIYYFYNAFGISCGVYLSVTNSKPAYSLIFIVIVVILFFYTKYLKPIALLGNFVVSFLIALSIYLVYLFDDIALVYNINLPKQDYFFIYAFFAFILNFIREIVKDIEDIDGDHSQKMKTLPILIGKKRTQRIVFVLTLIPLLLSLYYAFSYFKEYQTTFYFLFFIIFPLGYFMYKILDVKSKKEFHKLSTLLKIIMFLGVLSILLIRQLEF